jgi:hypothetical protein
MAMIEACAFVMVELPRPHKIHCVPPLRSVISRMGGVTGSRCRVIYGQIIVFALSLVFSTDSRKWC